jgi:uncharacterized protein (DUF2126 family)
VHSHELKRPEVRRHLAKQLREGMQTIQAYVLPLKAVGGIGAAWQSSSWLAYMTGCLLAGDSPAGLRLPLNSLPWVHPEEAVIDPPRDP